MSYLRFVPITMAAISVTVLYLLVKFGLLSSGHVLVMPVSFLAILVTGFAVTIGLFIKNWRVILALVGAILLSWCYVYLLYILQ